MGEQHAGGVRSLVHHLIDRVRAKHDVSLEELRGWRIEQVQNAIDDARAEDILTPIMRALYQPDGRRLPEPITGIVSYISMQYFSHRIRDAVFEHFAPRMFPS